MSLELTEWGTSSWERCGEAGVCRGRGGGWCSAVPSLSPNFDEGTGRADSACSSSWGGGGSGKGRFFPLSKRSSAHSQPGLHHLLLCKCSWRLKPWQEEKNPRQGTTVSLHSFLEKGLGLQRNTQNCFLNTGGSAHSMLHSRVWHPQISAEPGSAGKAQPTGERRE